MVKQTITPEMLQDAWAEILLKLPGAEGRSFLQKSLTEGPVRLSAVIRTKDSMPGLLLQVSDASVTSKWVVRQLSGVRFDPVVSFEDWYGFPLMLADPGARDIFAVLASDIASAISGKESASARLETLFSRLALWHRFLRNRSRPMTDDEVRGLIGELSILGQLIQAVGVDASLEAWKGPNRELHDFRLAAFRMEVKTWSDEQLPRLFISDPSQIVVDEKYPVWLVTVQISPNEKSGQTLCNLVDSLRTVMDAAQLDIYNALLADYGYLAEQAELYPERYSTRDPIFYKVNESFPRIEASSIPAGVSCVKYAIELSAIADHARPSPIK